MIKHALNEARANPSVVALAGAGFIQGVYKHCLLPELSAKRAWLGLSAAVVAYDLLTPKGETLSEGVDRGLEAHPLITKAAIGYVGLHLLNLIPPKYDPFTLAYDIIK